MAEVPASYYQQSPAQPFRPVATVQGNQDVEGPPAGYQASWVVPAQAQPKVAPQQYAPSAADMAAAAQPANPVATAPARSTAFMNIPTINLPTADDMQKYYQDAFNQLQPYYAQKLKEAQGDLDEAKRRITYDYQTGMRYNTQDTDLSTQRQKEDLQSAMQKLGLTFKSEGDQESDTLNKRGIALVQDPTTGQARAATGNAVSYDAQGNPVYSGNQGQAGSEISMLQEDQRLRKEAENRAAQRNLQDIGIKSSRTQEQLGETQTRGTYDSNRQFQQTGEQLGEQQRSQAYEIAGQREQSDIQKQQIDQQNAIMKAQQQQAAQV